MKHSLLKTGLASMVVAAAALAGGAACAAPEEIVVFADEFEKPGKVGYELQINFAHPARRSADYPGEQPPDRILRVMPEVVWGLSDQWNLGLHLPASRNGYTGTVTVDGFKARLTHLDSRKTDAGSVSHGVNYELSYLSRRLSESSLVAELRGILGRRHGDWLFSVNPILNRPMNYVPGVDNRFNLDLFAKVMKSLGPDIALGLEHYAEFGALQDLTFGAQSGQTTFAVLEWNTRSHWELQFGIGHGWTSPVDKRVYKMMIGFPF